MAQTLTAAPLFLTKHDQDDDNWGAAQNTNHDVINQFAIDTNAALALKASIASLAFKADITYVDGQITALVNAAPGALNTLKELADAINDDASFAVTITNALALKADSSAVTSSLALKANIASPAFSGVPTAPTASALNNSTQLSTTAYVDAAVAVEVAARGAADALKANIASPTFTGVVTTPALTVGTAASLSGVISFVGSSSGTATISADATAANLTFNANIVLPNGVNGTPSVQVRSGIGISSPAVNTLVLQTNTSGANIDLYQSSTLVGRLNLSTNLTISSQVAASSLILGGNQTTGTAATSTILSSVAQTPTSGDARHVENRGTFAPTSGSAIYTSFMSDPTINQTGGANGTIRVIAAYPVNTALVGTEYLFAGGTSSSAAPGATLTDKFTVDINGNIVAIGTLAIGSAAQFAVSALGTLTVNSATAVTHVFANTVAATSGTSQSSPIFSLRGTYWDGAASQIGQWSIQTNIANGTNGNVHLNHVYTGAPSIGSRARFTGGVGLFVQNTAGIDQQSIEIGDSAGYGSGTGGFRLHSSDSSGYASVTTSNANGFRQSNNNAAGSVVFGLIQIDTAGYAFTSPSAGTYSLTNTTAATVGTPQSSHVFSLAGKYWTSGAASAADKWALQAVIGAGADGASVLTLTHTGTPSPSGGGSFSAFVCNSIVQINSGTSANTGNPTEIGLSLTHGNGTNFSLITGNGGKLASGQLGIYNGATKYATLTASGPSFAGDSIIGLTNTSTIRLIGGGSGSVVAISCKIQPNTGGGGAFTPTSGTQIDLEIGTAATESWNCSSGNATWNLIRVAPTLNTSGSYAGTVRGYYYNPTVTAAVGVTHRAFESSAGDVFIGGTGNLNVAQGTVDAPEYLGFVVEGVNNSVVVGPVDGSGNPNYGAISLVSTTATFKFVCATVNLELWIDGRYQKVADDNIVNVVLTNGADATHPAVNFIFLKKNSAVRQLTSADIGVTDQAPIFGNNQTQPSTSATATKKFWFNPMTNKWMSSVSAGAYVNDPIVPICVAVIDNVGVELGKAYWGVRMTPWKVMENFGQGTDGATNVQTGTVQKLGLFYFTSLVVSGGTLQPGSAQSQQKQGEWFSQAPVVVVGTIDGNARGTAGGAGGLAAANVGTAGSVGGSGGGGGGATAKVGALGGGRDSITGLASTTGGGGTGGAVTPTAGGAGNAAFGGGYPLVIAQAGFRGYFGAGGGAGGNDSANNGGSGGQGGGGFRILAPAVVVTAAGVLQVVGAAATNSAGGNSSGGGGGGGGYIGLYAGYFLISGTTNVAGGAAGTGTGTGTSGGAGGAGLLEQVKCW